MKSIIIIIYSIHYLLTRNINICSYNDYCYVKNDTVLSDKYYYKLIKPHKNKRDELILEDDIQNVVKEIWRQSKEALVDTYGEEFYERIKIEMKQTIKHEFF